MLRLAIPDERRKDFLLQYPPRNTHRSILAFLEQRIAAILCFSFVLKIATAFNLETQKSSLTVATIIHSPQNSIPINQCSELFDRQLLIAGHLPIKVLETPE